MPARLISQTDQAVIFDGLNHIICEFPGEHLNVLEVGVCHGDTSRAIRDYMVGRGAQWTFWGIDNNRDLPVQVPFPGANLIIGESDQVYKQVPDQLHFVFIDGCHDINHVMLDFLHYGDRVVANGMVAFHDVSPKTQNKLDWQGYGPKGDPDFGTATREALRKLGLLNDDRMDWAFVCERWDDGDSGGTALVKRTRRPKAYSGPVPL